MGSYQYYRQIFEVDTSGGSCYIPEYHRTIQAFEVAFLLGYQAQPGRRLSIDFFGGIGGTIFHSPLVSYRVLPGRLRLCFHFTDNARRRPHFAPRRTTRTPLRHRYRMDLTMKHPQLQKPLLGYAQLFQLPTRVLRMLTKKMGEMLSTSRPSLCLQAIPI
jgi:hypothetical protein